MVFETISDAEQSQGVVAQSARDYLQSILDEITQCGGAFHEQPRVRVRSAEDTEALLRATAVFDDGLRLVLAVLVDTSGVEPFWPMYTFHFMDAENDCIFRFDNTPHYPHLRTFPHHKHESGAVELADVLNEIRCHIEPTT